MVSEAFRRAVCIPGGARRAKVALTTVVPESRAVTTSL